MTMTPPITDESQPKDMAPKQAEKARRYTRHPYISGGSWAMASFLTIFCRILTPTDILAAVRGWLPLVGERGGCVCISGWRGWIQVAVDTISEQMIRMRTRSLTHNEGSEKKKRL